MCKACVARVRPAPVTVVTTRSSEYVVAHLDGVRDNRGIRRTPSVNKATDLHLAGAPAGEFDVTCGDGVRLAARYVSRQCIREMGEPGHCAADGLLSS